MSSDSATLLDGTVIELNVGGEPCRHTAFVIATRNGSELYGVIIGYAELVQLAGLFAEALEIHRGRVIRAAQPTAPVAGEARGVDELGEAAPPS